MCVIKKIKFEDYKNCLKEAQTKNKLSHLEKHKIDADSLKEFIKNDKLILNTQRRFNTESHSVLTKKLKSLL